MAPSCPAPNAGGPLAPAIADYLDCHARALGGNGAQALASGGMASALLTSCLIIYVGLIGYRLILGQAFGVRDAVLSVARVALVIAFCTRWPGYDVVIYRVVTDGPNELASAVLKPSDVPVLSASETATRIQNVYDVMQSGAPRADAGAAPRTTGESGAQASTFPNNASGNPSSGQNATSWAGILFMMSSLGVLLAVRFAGATVLSVGPLIIALALFDSLRGLFEGWVRALVAITLGSAGVLIVLAIELTFLQAEISGAEAIGATTPNGQDLMIAASLFAVVQIAVLTTAGLVARGFRLPNWRASPSEASAVARAHVIPERRGASQTFAMAAALEPPSRAQAIADAVTHLGRSARAIDPGGSRLSFPRVTLTDATRRDEPIPRQPLGSSLRRNLSARPSPSIARRNELR